MSVILFKLVSGKPEKELCDPLLIDDLLKSGYALSSDKLLNQVKADTNNTGKLSDAEVKEAAKLAGIKVGRKSIKDNMSGAAQEHALRMWSADKSAAEFGRQDGYRAAETDAFEIYNFHVDHEDLEKRLSPMDAFYEIPESVRASP